MSLWNFCEALRHDKRTTKKSHGTQLHAHPDGRKQGSRSWQQEYNNLQCTCNIVSVKLWCGVGKWHPIKKRNTVAAATNKNINELVAFEKLRQQKKTVSTSETVPENRTHECAAFADAEADVENVLSLSHPPDAISSQLHPTGNLFSFHFTSFTCLTQ